MLNSQEQRRRIAEELARIARLKAAEQAVATPPPSLPGELEPVAIIGLSGYFPGCDSIAAFWRAVEADRCLLEPTPAARLALWRRLQPGLAEFPGRGMQGGGFIPDIRGFAPEFFQILPGQAHAMDPRQRLLLMSVYHTLEDAGYAPRALQKQPIGVFVGIEEDEYWQTLQDLGVQPAGGDGPGASLVANRISWCFDFWGPSEVVNTMCSGAAVALHRAVASLRAGETTMAIVGAANLLLRPEPFIGLSQSGQLSPDLAVRSFGKGANGFLRSEGVASVLLKRLAHAERDGDPIYAVIRHTAVNFNGKGGMSIAAPDIAAHAELIARCYRQAGIDPRELGYIEAQGMGNPLADLAEWQAFNRALAKLAGERGVTLTPGACRVGTLKPMAGHLHSASALGALFKIIHSLRTGTIHKILGFSELHPELAGAGQPCAPARDTEPWPGLGRPRLAGLHSYGAGGNNAHLLIQEYRDTRALEPESGPVVIPVSAESDPQRLALVRRLLEVVEQHPEYTISAVARTLSQGRDALPCRVAFVADGWVTWLAQARAFLAGESAPGMFAGSAEADARPLAAPAEAASLAQAWVRGAAVAWPRAAARRLRLPGYPFALKACWYDRLPPLPASNPLRAPADSPARGQAEAIVRALLGRYLEIAPARVDLDAAFVEQGFSSLMVSGLASDLRAAHAITLEPAQFFEFKTPRQLAQALETLLPTATPARPVISAPDSREIAGAVASAPTVLAPIAVIGLAGTYPGAASVEEFWENLRAGRDGITEVPEDRWRLDEHFDPNPETAAKHGKSYGKWGGFIAGMREFDPLFFKISPLEAEVMNPKERLVLQTVWHALEDAGHTPESLSAERVGVFFGVTRAGWDPYPGTFSSVANRVSYFCDFHGPSLSLDTMCSSSLAAIHEACQHLWTGGCEVAVAGGVNLYLHPSHWVVLSHGRFLSPDGVCRPFGAGANGMTPGEGVGAALLKPLAKALRDGDRIYGVIRGSACNHGGAANGFTAPNPAAQKDLVLQALRNAQVNPRQVTYVETHGTGTSLGDPVEIRGLTEAYRQYTAERGYCRIGSLKSNLGHLEAAAGIASLTKVLMQLRHRELAASLHAAELNPKIDFSATPFVVQQALESWQPTDAAGRPLARLAGISSFGAGGSNVHLIVEEAPGVEENRRDEGPCLIVLSARNEDRLRAVARNLREFLRRQPSVSLSDVAYTLQVGRAAMEERLAIRAGSLEELGEKLDGFQRLEGNGDAVWRGRVETRREGGAATEPEDAGSLATWVRQRDLESLGQAWVRGSRVHWKTLYSGEPPSRLGLPLYPFARVVIPPPNLTLEPAQPVREAVAAHPLAQRNTSTLNAQRMASTLTGREFFLAHHVVAGRKTLSAAASLEMARAAVALSLPPRPAAKLNGDAAVPVVRFSQVVWSRPLCVDDQPLEVQVALQGNAAGPVAFEIRSVSGLDSGAMLVHGQGTIEYAYAAAPQAIDLESLRPGAALEFSAEQCYAAFAALGIDYGPGHRGLDGLRVGGGQVLARLRLPNAVQDTASQYVLHPSLIDAAFQGTIGFGLAEAGLKPASHGPANPGDGKWELDKRVLLKPCLPYAIEQMEVFQPCVPAMWAVIRRPAGPERSGAVAIFDLDLCDERGGVLARIKGFAARVLAPASAEAEKPSLMLRVPHWGAKAAVPAAGAPPVFERRVVVCCGLGPSLCSALSAGGALEPATWIEVPLKGHNLAKDFHGVLLKTFGGIRSILDAKPKGDSLIQVLLGTAGASLAHSGLIGLLRTAQLESPRLRGQLIQVGAPLDAERLAGILRENAAVPDDTWVRYLEDGRQVVSWNELALSSPPQPWRGNGVYLISGGLGGLGRVFAGEIAQRAPQATIILIGRSELGEDGDRFLQTLRDRGVVAEYRQVDLRRRVQVKECVRDILAKYGALHGVLHAAGALRDQYLLRKTAQDIEWVIGPKVAGTVNLDEATRAVALDFFVLFSSGATLGNPGQGDYAAANAFLDGFADYRNELARAGARHGSTVAIAWPFWQAGGMRMDAAAQARMREQMGLAALTTAAGLDAFYQCLASGRAQVLVLYGELGGVEAALASEETIPAPMVEATPVVVAVQEPPPNHPAPDADLTVSLTEYLKRLICETLKLQSGDLQLGKDLYGYGLDSIIALEVNNRLEQDFPKLSKTLFFEYSNIQELAGYFLQAHRAKVERMFAAGATPPARVETVPAAPQPLATNGAKRLAKPEQVLTPPPRSITPATAPEPRSAEAVTRMKPRPNGTVSVDEILRTHAVEIHYPTPRPSSRAGSDENWPNWYSVLQSFAIFERRDPEFSFSRMLAGVGEVSADAARYLRGQLDLRRVLFRREDFSRLSRIVDLGCGRAADLIELALSYPGLQAQGLTVDSGEAAFARDMIRRQGLADRVRVMVQDNAAHEYERGCELAFSIQVMHFIPELDRKRELFRRLAAALGEEGVLLMAEFVCLLGKPMRDPALNTTVHTASEWAAVLGETGLVLEEVADLSDGIANFLHDPNLETHIAPLAAARQLEIRKYNHQVKSLENHWACYGAMRARLDRQPGSTEQRIQRNLERLTYRTSLEQVCAGLSNGRDGARYRDFTAHFAGGVASPSLPNPALNPLVR
jgi:acyl transferase domain-containing protein